MKIFYGYITTFGYLISILITITFISNKFNIKQDTSRKLIHILVGFSWIFMAYFFNTGIHLIIPPLIFMIINYISYKKELIRCMEQTRKSKGTIYYALSFSILSLVTILKPNFLPFYGIGVLTMAIGDGLAPFIGKKFNKWKIGNTHKTYLGSFTIFLTAIIVSFLFSKIYLINYQILDYLIVGIASSILELIGDKYDNLTLPIGVSFLAYLLA